MVETGTFPYEFHPYEPATLVEIYLPKKAKYQGILYDTLTKGFKTSYVKEHLQTADENVRQQIRELFGK